MDLSVSDNSEVTMIGESGNVRKGNGLTRHGEPQEEDTCNFISLNFLAVQHRLQSQYPMNNL